MLGLFLVGCVSIQVPTAPPIANSSINIMKKFPIVMPKGSSQFEDTQLVFVHADQTSEFALGLLIPVPFVTDAVVNAYKEDDAEEFEKRYHSLSPFDITLNELSKSPTLKSGMDGYNLYPLIFIEECFDDVYRFSLAYQLERGEWINRYYYHLPTKISLDDIAKPSNETLRNLSHDLHEGAKQLLTVIDKDINQQYPQDTQTASVGSLYIVGSKIAGLTSPNIMAFNNAQILSESNDVAILRIPGDPTAKTKAGGMAFGVHYFHKKQLHTYEPK